MSIWTEATDRYKPGYKPPPSLRVLISGLPRSGTFFLQEVLNQYLPNQVGHEAIFGFSKLHDPPDYGFRDPHHPPIRVEISGMSAPWVPDLKAAGIKIVQLLRHPVRCISSNLNYFDMCRHPITWDDTCETYLNWHRRIETHADITIYLEHLPMGLAMILDWLNIHSDIDYHEAMNKARRGTSTPLLRGTWADLPSDLQTYAENHGYHSFD